MYGDGGAAAAYYAHVANAVKASGALVQVEPDQFLRVLRLQPEAVVVVKEGRKMQYAVSYSGFVFWTKTRERLHLGRAQTVLAKRFAMPSL